MDGKHPPGVAAIGWLLAIVLLLSGGWIVNRFFLSVPEVTTGEMSAPSAVAASEESLGTSEMDEELPEESLALQAPQEASQREIVAVAPVAIALKGRITAKDGTPIQGATLTWVAWDPAFLPFVISSVRIPADRILAATLSVRTNSAGEYVFESVPNHSIDEVSFIHITCPGFAAATIELTPGETDLGDRSILELAPAPTVLARVLQSGKPVPGAQIYQQASYPRGSVAPLGLGKMAPKGRLLFLRVHDSDAAGEQVIAKSEYPQVLWAETDRLRSITLFGDHSARVDLELQPCFELFGTVLFPDPLPEGWSINSFGTAMIQVQRVRGSLLEEIALLAVDEGGSFESTRIPVLEADNYQISLVGGGFVPTQQSVPSPLPGDVVRVDFEAETGHVLWFQAEDADGEPIPNPFVTGRWRTKGQYHERVFPGRADGYVYISGLPAGAWTGVMGAKGYGPAVLETYVLPLPEQMAFPYTLLRGSTLKGKCLAGILPQEDFELRYWLPGLIGKRSSKSVLGSKDGSFIVEDLPGTRVSICAIGPGFERSETVTVQLSKNAETEVLLILGPPGEMRGRLIDAGTGAPIEDSRAEIYTTYTNQEMDPIGPAKPTTGGGQFAVRRLARGVNVVCFRAPGYSSRELKVWYEGEDVDLGDIELTPLRPLTARLSLPEGGDPTDWVMIADGITALPPTRFDANGELRIEECHAGVYTFEIIDYMGEYKSRGSQSAWLKEGEPWHLEFDRKNGPTLMIATSGADVAGKTMFARVVEPNPGSEHTIFHQKLLDDQGQLRLTGMHPGVTSIRVFEDVANGLAGYVLIEIPDDYPTEIQVDVPISYSATTVQVVDRKGVPQPNIQVRMGSARWPGLDLGARTSSSNGTCTFHGLYQDVDRVTLISSAGGIVDDLPFEFPRNPGETVQLVFDVDASLELHITDAGVPQPLATCRLLSADGTTYVMPGRSPDEMGLLVLDQLGAGSYELRVVGHGFWPVSLPVEATLGGARYDVDIRRTGDLTLRLRTLAGAALVGEEMDLEFVPYGEDVREWASSGKLKTGPNTLRTDGEGEIHLLGIPHGGYRWAYGGQTGTLEVRPTEAVIKEIVVP